MANYLMASVSSTPRSYNNGDTRPLRVNGEGALVTAGSSSNGSPAIYRPAQGTVVQTTVAMVANTAVTLVPAGVALNGCRIVNYITAPIYFNPGVTGTPASGAPSDYIPAAAAGPIPAQFESPFAPVDGIRAVTTGAGSVTVEYW